MKAPTIVKLTTGVTSRIYIHGIFCLPGLGLYLPYMWGGALLAEATFKDLPYSPARA